MTTMDRNNGEATEYLTALLNKTLRISTTDSRIFVGTMKCTDQVTTLCEGNHPGLFF